MHHLLKRSLKEKKAVEMMYLSNSNEVTHRRIVVTEIHGHHFKAYCFLRHEYRLFKTENVLAVLPEKRKFLHIS